MDSNSFFALIGTFFGGALVILLAIAAYWIVSGSRDRLRDWIKKHALLPINTAALSLLALASFGTGVFVDGATDFMSDSELHLNSWVNSPILGSIGTAEELRFETIFHAAADGSMEGQLKLGHLGQEVFSLRSTLLPIVKNVAFLSDPEKFVNSSDGRSRARENASHYVNQVYYYAKNWAFAQPTYYAELERLQMQLGLARSTYIVLAWALMAALTWAVLTLLLAGVLALLPNVLRNQLGTSWSLYTPSEVFAYLRRGLKRILFVTVVTGPLFMIGKAAYSFSAEQFNKRVFGYFVSATQREESDRGMRQLSKAAFSGVAWMRASAEYDAVCREVYRAAGEYIAHHSGTPTAHPQKRPAVVMDLDETVLSTIDINAALIDERVSFTEERWRSWLRSRQGPVRTVPGAVEFIRAARANGVMPVFVSNRDPSVRDLTVHALVLAGCGSEEQIRPNLYLSGGEIGKTDNFVLVNSRYQVVAWIGDNLADCDSRFEAPAGLDVDRRKALVAELADTDKIGNGYFLLPNPVYGEWSTLVDWQTPLRYFDH